jgi:flagellar L-ring protein precursor FlgH
MNRTLRLALLAASALSLAACGNTFSRLSEMGREPGLSPIANPQDAQPKVTMPMPRPEPDRAGASLWRTGARAFFKDQRANQIGDVVTVVISVSDNASLSNSSTRGRTANDGANIRGLFGYDPAALIARLPGNQPGVNNGIGAAGQQGSAGTGNLLGMDGTTNSTGTGTISRTESVSMRVAAVVTQVLPNGNLVLYGTQEVRVNYEARILQVTGVARPSDILSDNTIRHDRLAEARVAYGGKGTLSDLQQPRWGFQVIDIISPF